ncbi:MAG: hypothetical protein JO246_06150 [Frankiaceae bacterium]|nr:hypothetical protein [Frankiaceae bacterium]MBV9872995.1 hypothetical protein [Frankiaceae bacterium]
MTDPVTLLLAAIESGQPMPTDVFADDVVVDATVPGWRMTLRGPDAVAATFARWYADAGRFEELTRTDQPGGEIVRFLLTWVEAGVPHAAHQAHFIDFDDVGRIQRDEVFCGGRWDAGLLAEMEEADRASA